MRGGPAVAVTAAVAVVVMLAVAWRYKTEPTAGGVYITLGKDTTRIISPVRGDGTVDYIEAVNETWGKGVTKENNAAVILLGLSAKYEGQDAYFSRVEKAFGYEIQRGEKRIESIGEYWKRRAQSTNAATMLAVTTKAAASTQEVDDAEERARRKPWKSEDEPIVSAWLTEIAPVLEAIKSATARPRYFAPMTRATPEEPMFRQLFPSISSFKAMCNGLQARAMNSLGEGRVEDAISDIEAMHRLGGLIGERPDLLSELVGLAMQSLGCDSSNELIKSGLMTRGQLLSHSRFLEGRKVVFKIIDSLDTTERYSALDVVEQSARFGPDKATAIGDEKPGAAGMPDVHLNRDWNGSLRKINSYYDRAVSAMRLADFKVQLDALEVVEDDVAALVKGSVYAPAWDDQLLGVMFPSIRKAWIIERRNDAKLNVTKAAIALELYRHGKGRYPDQLEALVPDYFESIPSDPFTGKPLKYKLAAGGYLLYSIGDNLVDDGGVNDRKVGKDDLGFERKISPK